MADCSAGNGGDVLAVKLRNMLEELTLIKKLSDLVRVTGHLVHVVRNRANDAVQVSQLLGNLSGKLSAVLMRAMLEIG